MTTTDDTAPEQFTPTDEQVKAEWIASLSTPDPDNYWDAISEEEAQARWSRWIAAHDARVRRDAARSALDGLETEVRAKSSAYQQMYLDGVTLWVDELANWTARHRDTHYPETGE